MRFLLPAVPRALRAYVLTPCAVCRYAAGLASVDDDSGAEFDFDDELEDDESEDDEDPKKEIDLDDDEKKRPAKKQRR